MSRITKIRISVLFLVSAIIPVVAIGKPLSDLEKAQGYRALYRLALSQQQQRLKKIYNSLNGKNADLEAEKRARGLAWTAHFLSRLESLTTEQKRDWTKRAASHFSESGDQALAKWAQNWSSQGNVEGVSTKKSTSLDRLNQLDRVRGAAVVEDGFASIKASDQPDFTLVLNKTVVGESEIVEKIDFYDPVRIKLLALKHAKRSLISANEKAKSDDALESLAILEQLSGRFTKQLYSSIQSAKTSDIESARVLALLCEVLASWQELSSQKPLDGQFIQKLAQRLSQLEHGSAWTDIERVRNNRSPSQSAEQWQKNLDAIKESLPPGHIGKRKLVGKFTAELWALALTTAQSEKDYYVRAGTSARQALDLVSALFEAGSRGEMFKPQLPGFWVELGSLYIYSGQSRLALMYVFDAEAVKSEFPDVCVVAAALQDQALLSALHTNDAKIEAEVTALKDSAAKNGALVNRDNSSNASVKQPVKPTRSIPVLAIIIVVGGVVLLGVAVKQARSL